VINPLTRDDKTAARHIRSLNETYPVFRLKPGTRDLLPERGTIRRVIISQAFMNVLTLNREGLHLLRRRLPQHHYSMGHSFLNIQFVLKEKNLSDVLPNNGLSKIIGGLVPRSRVEKEITELKWLWLRLWPTVSLYLIVR